MSFSAQVLVRVGDYMDITAINCASHNARRAIAREIADALNETEVDGCYPRGAWNGADMDDYIFGSMEPVGVLSFARRMRKEVRDTAASLLKMSKVYDVSVAEVVQGLTLDSSDSYRVKCAFELLDNHPNPEATMLTFNDYWRVFPSEELLQKIQKEPKEWAVLPILFHD